MPPQELVPLQDTGSTHRNANQGLFPYASQRMQGVPDAVTCVRFEGGV